MDCSLNTTLLLFVTAGAALITNGYAEKPSLPYYHLMSHKPGLTLLALALAAPILAQDHPNFSGVWGLNAEKSKFGGNRPENFQVKIEQDSAKLVITVRAVQRGAEEVQAHRYTFGPEESKNEMHGAPMKSQVAWEGSTLVIRSVATFGNNELHLVDRWSLAADGKSLTFSERHQFASEPEGEQVLVLDRQPDDAFKVEPPKPAEQVYKNIQIFQGVPSTRIMTAMNFFTRWLGVQCTYCHVEKEFEKDDKPAKQTARKMYRMVMSINKENFGGPGPVTCWMCHRGQAKPQSLPQ